MKTKRPYMYEILPSSPGIKKHKVTGHYQATKKIKSKTYRETFKSLRDARHWRNTFNGERTQSTGMNQTSTLGEVWSAMQRLHFPSLRPSTRQVWLRRYRLLEDLAQIPMGEITPTRLNEWIEDKVDFFKSEAWDEGGGSGKHARCNLDTEINLLSTIFNWYKLEDQFFEESKLVGFPIRKRHRGMGFIKPIPLRHKKIPIEDAFKFFSALKPLYYDLALTQFYCAGRIGEIAGIQISNIDLNSRRLVIKETCYWNSMSKTFVELNPFPKNKEPRYVFITDELMEIIKRRLIQRWPGSNFLFHVEGKPLNYGTIQVNYRQAQRKTGIAYTGTHCLRHGMATLARKVGGGLDAAIAMTGHKDVKLADHYSSLHEELQMETSIKIMDHIKKKLGHEETPVYENVIPLKKRCLQ